MLGTSLVVNLDGFVSQRVSHTEIHEGIQNYDVQVLVEFVHQVSQMSSHLLQVDLSDLDLLRILKIYQLRVSQNLKTPEQLRNSELIWVDPLCSLDILKNDIKRLHKVVNLLQEVLLVVLLHVVLLLLESGRRLMVLELSSKSVDQHREHLVMRLSISERQI